MVGMIIDHGPYAASMIGDYDKDSKTVQRIAEKKVIEYDFSRI